MHTYFAFPNPLARLTRLLVAFEERRSGETGAAGPQTQPVERPVADDAALDDLSLSRHERLPEEDPLAVLSLTSIDTVGRSDHDALSDASLEWSEDRHLNL